jgi:hypothetical protein
MTYPCHRSVEYCHKKSNMNNLTNFNWIGVLLSFLAYFVLGALWFTALFAKQYRASLGRENEPPQKPAPIFIVGPAICSLVITLATAALMSALDIHSFGDAIKFGLIVGIGYLFANTVNIAINPNIPRPIYYGVISGMYHLVGILMVTVILQASA